MLYPITTESRMLFSLDGVWDFALREPGEPDDAPIKNPIPMPVPAAYNDIYPDAALRDHVGEVVYERRFTAAPPMLAGRLVLRFGSVTHHARVYLNGRSVAEHRGGFLPFEVEISALAQVGENTLRVIVDNILDLSTLPVGNLSRCDYPGLGTLVENEPNFDFFNYAGIMRPVVLYTTPRAHIDGLRVVPTTDGAVQYEACCTGYGALTLTVEDETGLAVATAAGTTGSFTINAPTLWWPGRPYLYRLKAVYRCGGETDCYELPFGIRSVSVEDNRFLINGRPFYFKGFGKHEDSIIHGRGLDEAVNVKDLALMEWIGANSLRTSHYPYAEEMLRLCDRRGIVVIDELPAVGLHTNFMATKSAEHGGATSWDHLRTAGHHRDVLEGLIRRDENYACVVMWSLANEPAAEEEGAGAYFAPLFRLARELDPQRRPVTVVTYEGCTPERCQVAPLADVLVINRYFGWYNSCGRLDLACARLKDEMGRWHEKYPQKPMMFGEYGADAVAGLHALPAAMFSEEYQVEFLSAYHALFDELDWFVGEHVWNFADFATAQNTMRVMGNRKGIFTRDRQPKSAAFLLRKRWNNIPNFDYK